MSYRLQEGGLMIALGGSVSSIYLRVSNTDKRSRGSVRRSQNLIFTAERPVVGNLILLHMDFHPPSNRLEFLLHPAVAGQALILLKLAAIG
jgi:hypothetical protein